MRSAFSFVARRCAAFFTHSAPAGAIKRVCLEDLHCGNRSEPRPYWDAQRRARALLPVPH
jgi:hypothetical protein